MLDELYKVTDAGWFHYLPVEWLIYVIIIHDKNLCLRPTYPISGCEGTKCIYLWNVVYFFVLLRYFGGNNSHQVRCRVFSCIIPGGYVWACILWIYR
jgi:hypothetical protein